MRAIAPLLLLVLALAATAPASLAQPQGAPRAFLPMVSVPPGAVAPTPSAGLRVNAPYIAANPDNSFSELAVFWFGQVTPTQNYADVRVGYTSSELYIYSAVFDRRLWHDTSPQPADLSAWDAVTLYLDTGQDGALSANSHRIVAQFSGAGGAAYQATYGASGGAWAPSDLAVTTRPGWRGDGINDNQDDRGWVMTYRLPFASLGLATRPPDGAAWRMALVVHDRDDAAGAAIADQSWPPSADLLAPQSWGALVFGAPSYAPPATSNPQTVTIRQGLDGAVVPDAGVGGGSVCGDGLDFWSAWGDSARDAGKDDFNVQNQSDIADWPCFAKYFVTFPLDSLPEGQTVIAARLVLHQFGNSEPSQAEPSRIQALTVAEGWQEGTLTWNNAPLATENVGAGWVAPLAAFSGWPGVPRELDVTYGVARAYAAGGPLRLALYSADDDYHSGKYFVSSDTGDWNAVARPTLVVTLGTPAGE